MYLKNMHKKLFSSLTISIFFLIQDKWPQDKLRKALDYLKLPAFKPGKSFVYRLWKALLHQWLSNSNCEVYLVTPFLDVKRMTDICNIVIEHSGTANIEAFYVREKCFKGYYEGGNNVEMKISDIIRKVKRDKNYRTPSISSTIERKIFQKVRKTTDQYFHAKLIACTSGNNAMVLVTSANFAYANFDIDNYETVVYHEMSTVEFSKRFIEHLNEISN